MRLPIPSASLWLAAVTLAGVCVLSGVGLIRGPAEDGAKPAPGPGADTGKGPPRALRFGRDIRPLLSDRCLTCHGPDAAKRQADLRLDQFDAATAVRKNGKRAIVPGDVGASELWRRINSPDHDDIMPPSTSTKRPLSKDEKELLRHWIEAGAVYEPHWAFVAPTRPPVPGATNLKNESWCRNDIDRFILARQQQEGLTPSPEADKATLLRRVFLDLTGLPPTPEEVQAFEADANPRAYEKWVDRLLGEEPYVTRTAERLATPWLDAARYADTCGIHMDAGRQMWLWRDWVINAYRTNMPFDQFVTEQMAGDLMPDATTEQKIASGFNRNHVTTDEGGAIAEEYLVEYAVDRAATTGSVFLGLTVGCARCHDHKFDPISTEEFYKFYSFFNSIEEPGLYSQDQNTQRAHEPFMEVPTPEQGKRLADIAAEREEIKKKEGAATSPEEESQLRAFTESTPTAAGIHWARAKVTSAKSPRGSTLTIEEDGSVFASGANPAKDVHEYTVNPDELPPDSHLLLIEGLADTRLPAGRTGRAPNGNAVLSGVDIERVPREPTDNAGVTPIHFSWVWADVQQQNEDFNAANLIPVPGNPTAGWAVASYLIPGDRHLVLMTDEALTGEGGGGSGGNAGGKFDLRIRLHYESIYDLHTFGHERLSVGSITSTATLPVSATNWRVAGPFAGDRNELYEKAFGPESATKIDFEQKFASSAGDRTWRIDNSLKDGAVVKLESGTNVTYLGRMIYAPTKRHVEVSLGSDDGWRLFVNGKEVGGKKIERAVAADQDKAEFDLDAGPNIVVLKIVNTGGDAGYYYKPTYEKEILPDALVAFLLPENARDEQLNNSASRAWKMKYSEPYRVLQERSAALANEESMLKVKVPRTMVMKELAMPRPTFVLTRGQYDAADKKRPVTRGVPARLGGGELPADAPANRLGLARWLMSKDNPLVARVAVNRMWEMLFGTGIERTSEDFGYQGEWPSHPELLDYLAVEFRDGGEGGSGSGEDARRAWDIRRMLKMMVTSATYRQSSVIREEVRSIDPDNRLLAAYPRRRLTAEQVRDSALYMSGLLVERAGGPSVKPYQPDGLWREVAMPQSNTRAFERGKGEDLWRRSLYTYWKRAAPPPSLLTFDAPTREFCVVRRASTSTPLQALVLWNDPQYVEASRVLAQRTMAIKGDDAAKIMDLFRRCTAHTPDAAEMALLSGAIKQLRERFANESEDAGQLVSIGDSPIPDGIDNKELAAWTMLSNAVFNLYRTTTQE